MKVLKGVATEKTIVKFGYLGGLEPKVTYRIYLNNDPAGSVFVARLRAQNADIPSLESVLEICDRKYDIGSTYFRADREERAK